MSALDTALAFGLLLDELGIAHAVGGSMASLFVGEPRLTLDVDIAVALDDLLEVATIAAESS